MKRGMKAFLCCLFALLVGLLPVGASANSAEPPCFTVVVSNAPEDLELSLQYEDGSAYESLYLRKQGSSDNHGWESYYRFAYTYSSTAENLQDVRLLVQTGGESFLCPLPKELNRTYNGMVTLDLKDKTLTCGTSPLRTPLLIALRIALTLLIEGLVFFLFGYRAKRSWLVFAIVNLITQIGLNLLFAEASSADGYIALLLFFYAMGEAVVFLLEVIAFSALLKEHSKKRAACCALLANAASLLVGGLCLTYLPF